MLSNPWSFESTPQERQSSVFEDAGLFSRPTAECLPIFVKPLYDALHKWLESDEAMDTNTLANRFEKFKIEPEAVSRQTKLEQDTVVSVPTVSKETEQDELTECPVPSAGYSYSKTKTSTGWISKNRFDSVHEEFPPAELAEVVGKIAVLYPISSSEVRAAVSAVGSEADHVHKRTGIVLTNWLIEVFGDAYSDVRCGEGVECNGCKHSIRPFSLRVKCLECTDFDFCESCFANHVEGDGHFADHIYYVYSSGTQKLFDSEWSASEDATLLEAVGKFGFGNWGEVADWVAQVTAVGSTEKLKEQCEDRYFNFHLVHQRKDYEFATPFSYDRSKEACEIVDTRRRQANPEKFAVDYSPVYDQNGFDLVKSSLYHTLRENRGLIEAGAGNKALGSTADPTESERARLHGEDSDDESYELPRKPSIAKFQATKPPNPLPNRVAISGYLPFRGDLDVEWENCAEMAICDLNLRPDESPMEKEAKLLALEAYNCILDERWMRKRLYLDRRIYEQKTRANSDSSDVSDSLKPLLRFIYPNYSYHPPALFIKTKEYFDLLRSPEGELLSEEFDEIPDLFYSERSLEIRLNLLTAWYESGLKTVNDVFQCGAAAAEAVARSPTSTPSLALSVGIDNEIENWVRSQLHLNLREFKLFMEIVSDRLAASPGLKPCLIMDLAEQLLAKKSSGQHSNAVSDE